MARCLSCEEEFPIAELIGGRCSECRSIAEATGRAPDFSQSSGLPGFSSKPLSKLWLTTETAADLPIIARLGLVTGECAVGINILKDIGAGIRDVVGGRSKSLEASVAGCRKAAISDLRAAADGLGADAVVALSIQVQELAGGGKSMLLVTATGTAVRLASPAGQT